MASLIKNGRVGDVLLILGSNETTAALSREVIGRLGNGNGNGNGRVRVVGAESEAGSPLRLDPETLRALILEEGVSRIVVDPQVERQAELASALIECKFHGVRILDSAEFYENLNGKVWLEALSPEWFLFSDGFHWSKTFRFFKRTLDIACALLLLLISAPLLALIAVAIKLESAGPVFFKQERVGLDGRPFELIKFRSMRADAEKKTGPVWAKVDDDRVTRVGAFLRRFHLDELPQVFNVLRGEVSFVGPRPERPCFIEMLREHIPFYDLRHYMKPGITGWAQVSYDYGDSIEDAYEKLQYDLYYAKHASIRMDLWVLLKTVKVVAFGTGR